MQGKEKALQSQNKTRQSNRQDKSTDNIEQLKAYVQQSKYIDFLEQPIICKSFGLPYLADVFRAEYRQRFYNYLKEHTTTVATASKATKIPHKYLCEVKASYEKKELIKIVYVDRCPTTGSANVQFLSANPEEWECENALLNPNQIKLF